jgi:hypothetical protein
MKIERNQANTFTINFDNHSIVGFHATSSLACSDIESVGFLPSKIFTSKEHDQIVSEAKSLSIDTVSYEEWLKMRSVTFTKQCSIALSHLAQGNAGGQGLFNITEVLKQIGNLGDETQRSAATDYHRRIQVVRDAATVVYAVDLSNLGRRLVLDHHQQDLFQVYFDPSVPLPAKSIVESARIIGRLDVW